MPRNKIQVERKNQLSKEKIESLLTEMEPQFHALLNRKIPMGSLHAASMQREDFIQQFKIEAIKSWEKFDPEVALSGSNFNKKMIKKGGKMVVNKLYDPDKAALHMAEKTTNQEEALHKALKIWAYGRCNNYIRRQLWEASDKNKGASTISYDEVITNAAKNSQNGVQLIQEHSEIEEYTEILSDIKESIKDKGLQSTKKDIRRLPIEHRSAVEEFVIKYAEAELKKNPVLFNRDEEIIKLAELLNQPLLFIA